MQPVRGGNVPSLLEIVDSDVTAAMVEIFAASEKSFTSEADLSKLPRISNP